MFPTAIVTKEFTIYIEHLNGVTGFYDMEFPCNGFGIIPDEILKQPVPFMGPQDKKTRLAVFIKRTELLGNYLFRELSDKEIQEYANKSEGK